MGNNTETVHISIERYDELTKKEAALETISVLLSNYYITGLDTFKVKDVLKEVIETVDRKDDF